MLTTYGKSQRAQLEKNKKASILRWIEDSLDVSDVWKITLTLQRRLPLRHSGESRNPENDLNNGYFSSWP